MKQILATIHDFNPRLTSLQLTLILSILLISIFNLPFWREVLSLSYDGGLRSIGFALSFYIFLVTLLNLMLNLMAVKYIFKPIAIFILISASFATYFMSSYGVMLDRSMIQNVLETDPSEVRDLLNINMLLYVTLLGLLPSFLVYKVEIAFQPLLREMAAKLICLLVSLAIIGGIAAILYQDYASMFRNNRHIRHLVVPANYIYATSSLMSRQLRAGKVVVKAIGEDAKLSDNWQNREKKAITVLILGETARAANFSLQGYERETNPKQKEQGVLYFNNTYSCGTATAVSLPCMFSVYERDNYSDAKAKRTQGMLDVISHAGIKVLWRNNNSGCKGACDRVEFQDFSEQKIDELCNSKECFDEVLLYQLQDYLDKLDNNAVIVLHQKGSHGPAYYLRYPQEFNQFQPVCKTNQLQQCSREEIVNAYDNTILYTDYFIGQTIDLLKQNSEKFDTAMVYMSDHGESLGENGLYLHGMPYFVAPDEQKHVPFSLWLSPGFEQSFNIDKVCLRSKQSDELSHDNLFHSMLGIMEVESEVYQEKLDIFNNCKGR